MIMARVLTIAGSDSGGGAGIQADLKTIASLGGYGMTVVTALTAQNTLGVQGIHEVPLEFIERQFDSVASDIGVDAAKTGMLAGAGVVRLVARKIDEYGIANLVVDPVMAAKGGARLIQKDTEGVLLKELVPRARLVTPNIPEAEILCGHAITSIDDMKRAAEIIGGPSGRSVLVKGGHREGDALDILYDDGHFFEFPAKREDTKNTHGTGCTLSAAVATGLGCGLSVREAVARAKDYISTAIRFSLPLGGGHGPTNHMAALFRESSRYRCLLELKEAIRVLTEGRTGHVIPEIQSNLVYALPYARTTDEVAGVPGRIIRVGERVETLHDPDFGASSHVARIVLTLMKYDPDYRSAMDIRFSDKIVAVCRDLGYDVASFDRADEPKDVKDREGSSLEWGTDRVLAGRGGIPDMIFDRGDVGKEPIVRVLGKSPADVVAKVMNIAERIRRS
ncbi:MAG: hypothetical protein AVO39_06015 [delta proteobacterium MLS_D]|jgi:hydroxymethylpyrimidine kinase / phosphomethylpyrimidine kinase / thiamine-phosphate diphosphorylase|nr:MAG: hypothetical protein AVO39_06015 [delta proteobacterium MLS_D]